VRLTDRFRLTLQRRESLAGYMFTLPFAIGFVLFFVRPFVQSVVFSMSELAIVPRGYELIPVGVGNYRYSLFVHLTFVRTFVDQMVRMITEVPAVITFSFFAAVMLNQKFRGRMLARVIFFLPVILNAGIVLRIEQTDYITSVMSTADGGAGGGIFSMAALSGFFMQLRLPQGLLTYIMNAADALAAIIRASGIQILIFLAGLQSIPTSLFEAAEVEGATKWESFWKITFPMLSPLLLTNVVYTIIDSFTSPSNALVELIRNTAFGGGAGYGVSTAMACLYFLAVSVVMVIAIAIISPRVYYQQ
jgi:ABC-type sugar transport system permease subunit